MHTFKVTSDFVLILICCNISCSCIYYKNEIKKINPISICTVAVHWTYYIQTANVLIIDSSELWFRFRCMNINLLKQQHYERTTYQIFSCWWIGCIFSRICAKSILMFTYKLHTCLVFFVCLNIRYMILTQFIYWQILLLSI